MLGNVFERFVEKAPVAVMVRGILERVLGPDALNALNDRAVPRHEPPGINSASRKGRNTASSRSIGGVYLG